MDRETIAFWGFLGLEFIAPWVPITAYWMGEFSFGEAVVAYLFLITVYQLTTSFYIRRGYHAN